MKNNTDTQRISELLAAASTARNAAAVETPEEGFPALVGALEGLKILDITDYPSYQEALAEGMPTGWSYYFPYLLTQNRPGRSALLIGYDDGSVCVYRWRLDKGKARLDVQCAPMPLNLAVLHRCLERANSFNSDWSARVRRIDAKNVESISTMPHVRLSQRKSQYLFAPDNYTELSGKKFYTVRRNVKRVEQLPDVEVRPFTPDDAQEGHALLNRWRKAHRAAHGTAGGYGISRRAIDLIGRLPDSLLRGEAVYIGGKLAAFAFGGEIRPGLACSFERKAINDFRGISFYQLRSLLLRLRDYDVVNDGSDTGRAGLRQLKDSFRPIAMHAEFSAVQR